MSAIKLKILSERLETAFQNIVSPTPNNVSLKLNQVRYKDNRVIANGYFSVYRNEFISFSNKKISQRIDYDIEIDFF